MPLTRFVVTTVFVEADAVAMDVFQQILIAITDSLFFDQVCNHTRDDRGVDAAAQEDTDAHISLEPDAYSFQETFTDAVD